MARMRQSRPDSGLGFQVQVLETFHVVPTSFPPPQWRHIAWVFDETIDKVHMYLDGVWAYSVLFGSPITGPSNPETPTLNS